MRFGEMKKRKRHELSRDQSATRPRPPPPSSSSQLSKLVRELNKYNNYSNHSFCHFQSNYYEYLYSSVSPKLPSAAPPLPSSSSAAAAVSNSLLVIRRLLQTRGTLAEILTCDVSCNVPSLFQSIVRLSNTSLCILLSAIYQSEVQKQEILITHIHKKNIGDEDIIIRRRDKQNNCNSSNSHGPNTNAAAVLHFVERLLVARYDTLDLFQYDSTHAQNIRTSFVDSGTKHDSIDCTVNATSKDDSAVDDSFLDISAIILAWDKCAYFSPHTSKNNVENDMFDHKCREIQGSRVYTGRERLDCCDYGSDSDMYFIPCISFMMAYTALSNRLQYASFDRIITKQGDESRDCPNKDEHYQSDGTDYDANSKSNGNVNENDERKNNAMRNVAQDPTVLMALRLIVRSKMLAIAMERSTCDIKVGDDDATDIDGSNDETPDGEQEPVNHALIVFDRQMSKVNSLLRSLKEALQKDDVDIRKENVEEKEQNDFDLLWEKVQAASSDSDEDTGSPDQKQAALLCQRENEPVGEHEEQNMGGDKVHEILGEEKADPTANGYIHRSQDTTEEGADGTLDTTASTKRSDGPSALSTYEKLALDFRPILQHMPPNAVSDEVENATRQIAVLLKEGGAQDGALGIQRVASVLRFGSCHIPHDAIDEQTSDSEECIFSDSLLSSLSKAFVTEEISAARVTAFFKSIIQPSILALGKAKSRPASRQLISMLTCHARQRPTECIHSLLIPTMRMGMRSMESAEQGGEGQHGDGSMSGASKAQCELITRIVKSAVLPPDDMSRLASDLVPIPWTELSLNVLTTCIQKKPVLSDTTIFAFVNKLGETSKRADLAKNTKFSSLFHTFVTKYGSQLQGKRSCIDTLSEGAGRLKTFQSKTISRALKKLQS